VERVPGADLALQVLDHRDATDGRQVTGVEDRTNEEVAGSSSNRIRLGPGPLRITGRLIIAGVLGGAALYFVTVVAVNLIVWWYHDNLDVQRLRVLQADGIWQCEVATISPWHEREERSADTAGSAHSVGFGSYPTTVTRLFRLNGADPASVIQTFTECAQSRGWALTTRPGAALSGSKSFPGGWTAYLSIYIERRPSFVDQPIVQVSLLTEPI
jgi:hypothetical protein